MSAALAAAGYPAAGFLCFALGVAAMGRYAARRAPGWVALGVVLFAVAADALRALLETLDGVREPWARPLLLGLLALAAALRLACQWTRLGERAPPAR